MKKSRIASPVPLAESPLRHLPLVDLLVDTKTELLELALRSGLKVFTAMLEEDRAAICGRGVDPTSLVHNAFMRLVDARSVDWQDRAHFFAVAARIMRRILVDAARARRSTKRGGRLQRVEHSSATDFDRLPARGTDRADELRAR